MNKLRVRYVSLVLLALACVVPVAASDDSAAPAPPPAAKKVPKVTEIHGRKLVDDYYWLRAKSNPEVKAYLEAENAYTDAVMKPTEALQKKLYGDNVEPDQGNGRRGALQAGRVLLLCADGSREAVPDSLPEEGQHGWAGRGGNRSE